MQKCGKRRINDSSGYFVVLPIYVVVEVIEKKILALPMAVRGLIRTYNLLTLCVCKLCAH